MATKFSQFTGVAPTGTTEIVGLDGSSNAKFAVNTLDVSNLAGLPLPITSGGTGQITQPLALNALTDSANQTVNDILYIDNTSAAAFINPSDHPNIPTRIALYAEWLNLGGNSYFNIPKSTLVGIPYNDIQSNVTTESTGLGIVMTYNGIPGINGITTFTFEVAGQYKVGINLNFFDQSSANSGMSVFAGIYTSAGGTLIKGLINEVAGNHGKNDINYFGQNTFTAAAGDVVQIKIEFVGGSGNDPFPATTGGIAASVVAELIS